MIQYTLDIVHSMQVRSPFAPLTIKARQLAERDNWHREFLWKRDKSVFLL